MEEMMVEPEAGGEEQHQADNIKINGEGSDSGVEEEHPKPPMAEAGDAKVAPPPPAVENEAPPPTQKKSPAKKPAEKTAKPGTRKPAATTGIATTAKKTTTSTTSVSGMRKPATQSTSKTSVTATRPAKKPAGPSAERKAPGAAWNSGSVGATGVVRKTPSSKASLGTTPKPQVRNVKSKVGSLDNAAHKPGGGGEKAVVDRKTSTRPKVGSVDTKPKPTGAAKKVTEEKAASKTKGVSTPPGRLKPTLRKTEPKKPEDVEKPKAKPEAKKPLAAARPPLSKPSVKEETKKPGGPPARDVKAKPRPPLGTVRDAKKPVIEKTQGKPKPQKPLARKDEQKPSPKQAGTKTDRNAAEEKAAPLISLEPEKVDAAPEIPDVVPSLEPVGVTAADAEPPKTEEAAPVSSPVLKDEPIQAIPTSEVPPTSPVTDEIPSGFPVAEDVPPSSLIKQEMPPSPPVAEEADAGSLVAEVELAPVADLPVPETEEVPALEAEEMPSLESEVPSSSTPLADVVTESSPVEDVPASSPLSEETHQVSQEDIAATEPVEEDLSVPVDNLLELESPANEPIPGTEGAVESPAPVDDGPLITDELVDDAPQPDSVPVDTLAEDLLQTRDEHLAFESNNIAEDLHDEFAYRDDQVSAETDAVQAPAIDESPTGGVDSISSPGGEFNEDEAIRHLEEPAETTPPANASSNKDSNLGSHIIADAKKQLDDFEQHLDEGIMTTSVYGSFLNNDNATLINTVSETDETVVSKPTADLDAIESEAVADLGDFVLDSDQILLHSGMDAAGDMGSNFEQDVQDGVAKMSLSSRQDAGAISALIDEFTSAVEAPNVADRDGSAMQTEESPLMPTTEADEALLLPHVSDNINSMTSKDVDEAELINEGYKKDDSIPFSDLSSDQDDSTNQNVLDNVDDKGVKQHDGDFSATTDVPVSDLTTHCDDIINANEIRAVTDDIVNTQIDDAARLAWEDMAGLPAQKYFNDLEDQMLLHMPAEEETSDKLSTEIAESGAEVTEPCIEITEPKPLLPDDSPSDIVT